MTTGRDGRVTISTVAARCGRSISTVSAALNGATGVAPATRDEILAVAAELGYNADPRARLLRQRRTGLIGASFDINQDFQGGIVDGLYRSCAQLGRSLVLAASTPHRDEAEGLRSLLTERCEGLILVDPWVGHDVVADAAARVPVVMVCRESGLPNADLVRSRDDVGITALVDHLVVTGRRRITHIDGGRASSAPMRRATFLAAMAEHGLGGQARVLEGGSDEESGTRAVRVILDAGDLPDAILCFNDHQAIGALMELRRCGARVPEDVAVTGYDGIPATGLTAFSVTTIEQDALLLAEVAVRALVARMETREQGGGAGDGASGAKAGGGAGAPGAGSPAAVPPVMPDGVVVQERPEGGLLYSVMPRLVLRGTSRTVHDPR